MISRILIAFIILVILALFVFSKVNAHIDNLNGKLNQSNQRIEDLIQSDSIVNEKTKEYSNVITKYVNDCNVNVGSEVYSLSGFIDLYVNQIEEKNKLKDSLYKLNAIYKASTDRYGKAYKLQQKNDSTLQLIPQIPKIEQNLKNTTDSLSIYKELVKYIEKRYQVKSRYKINKNTISIDYDGIEKIDSAMALLPFYRHRISSENDKWSIEVDGKYIRSERKKKRQQKKSIKN